MTTSTTSIAGHLGARIAVHRVGSGRPVVLLHGLFSNAQVNWIKFGTARRLAEAGVEAIMPDLRAHGQSEAPHDPAAYPPDVLVRDLEAVVAELGLTDYDLVGFSLGSRTALKGVMEGLTPRRLVLGGMGLEGITRWRGRTDHFVEAIDRFDTITPGDPSYLAQQFMKTTGVDRVATRLLLGSIEGAPAAAFDRVTMPTLVLCGSEDRDNGSPTALVEALPHATYAEVPGTHMSCVTKPEFGEAIVRFLTN